MTFKQFKNKPTVKFITNRYVIILSFFIVWMFFFDENSLLNHLEFNKEINKLNNEEEYYKTQIKQDKDLIEKLKNKEELEKFAREKYHMKKENEEIYLIEYDTLVKN
ncbi:FtsB family cell division protein [Lutibacter sp.]